MPDDLWVALFQSATASTSLKANDATNALEVSTAGGSGYLRVAMLGSTGIDFNPASAGSASQDQDIIFPPAATAWGLVYAVALMTTATPGTANVFAYADLASFRDVQVPDVVRVPLGQIIVSL
jgi:hypothetical protein